MRDLKKYDSKLSIKKNIDGSIDIIRSSQFEKKKDYVVLKITNQFLGDWVLDKLKSMDSRHINIIDSITNKNIKLRNKKYDNRQHKDMADFIIEGNKIII